MNDITHQTACAVEQGEVCTCGEEIAVLRAQLEAALAQVSVALAAIDAVLGESQT